jgi:hypothetical protein
MPEVSITRPAAPRVEDYSVVPGSLGPRRDFRISVGLREGWDADGRVFDVTEAVRTARAWITAWKRVSPPCLACSPVRKLPTRGPAQTARSVRTANRWRCSLAKLSTPILVICPTRQLRRC